MSQPIPGDWLAETAKQFRRDGKSLDACQLRTLAEAGLTAGESRICLCDFRGGTGARRRHRSNFLLLRALALPEHQAWRKAVCASAAAQIARQRRDMEVVEKAVELIADSDFEELSFTPEQVSQVIRKEKAEPGVPHRLSPRPDYSEFLGARLCDCPECRRKSGEAAANPFEDFEEDDGVDGGSDLMRCSPAWRSRRICRQRSLR